MSHASDVFDIQSLPSISLFIPSLNLGGAERVTLNIATGLARLGIKVDLCVARAEGELLAEVPKNVRLVDLHASRPITAVPALAHYLRLERPSAIIASMNHTGFAALWARALARTNLPVVVRQESTWSMMRRNMQGRHRWLDPLAARLMMPRADHIIAVSRGVAEDLLRTLPLSPQRVTVIPNAVLDECFATHLIRPPTHPWFHRNDGKLIVSVGRMVHAKGFDLLLEAFAQLRQRKLSVRWLAYGDGPDRAALQHRARELGVADDVQFPGFLTPPYAAMGSADVFVVPSRYEGLGIVLVEALKARANIVAADCPSGPREVLDEGRFGRLVPPEDVAALVAAVSTALDHPTIIPNDIEEWLRPYSIEESVRAHIVLLKSVCRQYTHSTATIE